MKLVPKLLFKQSFAWAFLIFSVVCIHQSCRKTDFSNVFYSPEKEDRFFSCKSPVDKRTAEVMRILKAQNDRDGFVKRLPADAGLPIWNKLVFPSRPNYIARDDSAGDDHIVIPFTFNDTSLSTLMLANKINDSTYNLTWYTAADLYNVCYASSRDYRPAESLLTLFMYMEGSTFERKDFYHIPKYLFTGRGEPSAPGTKTLHQQSGDISITEDPNTGSFIGTVCFYIFSGNCTCNNEGICLDWWKPCLTGDCTTTICFNVPMESPCPTCGTGGGTTTEPPQNTPPPTPPGGGGPGDSCTSCPPQTPQCRAPFYIENPCAPLPLPPEPPGDTILNPCLHLKMLDTCQEFNDMMNFLQGRSNDPNDTAEHAVAYEHHSAGPMTYLGYFTGAPGTKGIDIAFDAKADGIGHNHYTGCLSIFSPDDLWSMATTFNRRQWKDSTRFTMPLATASGPQYMLMVENLTKFRNFAAKFAGQDNINAYRQVYKVIYGIREDNTISGNEAGFIRFLSATENGSGLRLIRRNPVTQKWVRLGLDNSNNIIEIPCP